MKIIDLSKSQLDLLAKYAQEGEKLTFCCAPIDEAAAMSYGDRLMKWLRRDHIATVIRDGPIDACCTVHMLAMLEARMDNMPPRLVWDQMEERIRVQFMDPIELQIQEQVNHKTRIRVRDFLEDQWLGHSLQIGRWLGEQCENRMWRQIKDQIWDQVKNLAWDRIIEQDDTVFPFLNGQWMAGYCAWLRYYREALALDLPDVWQLEDQLQFGGVFPLLKFVVVMKRPEFIHRNSSGRLHCDDGPALRYADGFSLFVMNGVRVPEWLAVKSAASIDPGEFAAIENAEVRREFVRKVGIELIVQSCGAVVLDKQGDYELLSVDLGGRTGKWPYLKMLNPSIGTWHLEAVAKDISTVEQALAWRNQSELPPEQLT